MQDAKNFRIGNPITELKGINLPKLRGLRQNLFGLSGMRNKDQETEVKISGS